MRKRWLSLVTAFVIGLSFLTAVPVTGVSAVTEDSLTVYEQGQPFSNWATMDLVAGDTYGIYPLEWYYGDMTVPITRIQLRKVISEVRVKLIGTDEVKEKVDKLYHFEKYSTVEDVLNYFYEMLTEFTFVKEIGISNTTAVDFMSKTGIYGSVPGEQALNEQCSIEQACVIGSRIVTYVYDLLDAGSKGFLWKTESGGNTVYMLGSIHLATTDIYPMDDSILKAFYSSDALAVELNYYDTAGAIKLAQLGVYADGTTLKDHVSAEVYQKTIQLAKMFGYAEEVISMCKPWYLYTQFAALSTTASGEMADASKAASLGIDLNFMTGALLTGKKILEVEGYEYQGKVLDSFSDDLEEYLLSNTIDTINDRIEGKTDTSDADDITAVLNLWKEGDTAAFEEYTSFDKEYPELAGAASSEEKVLISEFKDKLFLQRDEGMADYIDSLLKASGNNTYFVVVGSGHYISDFDVLDILTKKGYEITSMR